MGWQRPLFYLPDAFGIERIVADTGKKKYQYDEPMLVDWRGYFYLAKSNPETDKNWKSSLQWLNNVDDPIRMSLTFKQWYPSMEISRMGHMKGRTLQQELDTRYLDAQKHWEGSESCRILLQTLRTCVMHMRPITKIVCTDLGSPDAMNPATHMLHAFRYCVALSIASELYHVYHGRNSTCARLKIIAQDRNYSEKDAVLFRTLTPDPISIKSDPDGYLDIDANKIVIFWGIKAPYYEIIADLTYLFNGPAAILGIGVDIKSKKDRSRINNMDLATPRVMDMLKSYEMMNFDDLMVTRDEWDDCVDGEGVRWLWNSQFYYKRCTR